MCSNIVIGKNESKILTKDISCECKFDERKCKSNQNWNNDKCWCGCKKHHFCEQNYIWNLATCSCEIGKYLATIIDDSVIKCDEIIDAQTKSNQTYFNEKEATCKTQSFYILLTF